MHLFSAIDAARHISLYYFRSCHISCLPPVTHVIFVLRDMRMYDIGCTRGEDLKFSRTQQPTLVSFGKCCDTTTVVWSRREHTRRVFVLPVRNTAFCAALMRSAFPPASPSAMSPPVLRLSYLPTDQKPVFNIHTSRLPLDTWESWKAEWGSRVSGVLALVCGTCVSTIAPLGVNEARAAHSRRVEKQRVARQRHGGYTGHRTPLSMCYLSRSRCCFTPLCSIWGLIYLVAAIERVSCVLYWRMCFAERDV